jgi:hypothetical protein
MSLASAGNVPSNRFPLSSITVQRCITYIHLRGNYWSRSSFCSNTTRSLSTTNTKPATGYNPIFTTCFPKIHHNCKLPRISQPSSGASFPARTDILDPRCVMCNLLKPSGNFTYHQVQHSKILHGSHIAFVCFVWISEQSATFALYSINTLVFITEMESVYCAARTDSLYKADRLHL